MPIKSNFSSIYAKGVISLFKGNLWAQAIGLIGTLIVANLYGSDALGVFSKFISISSILAIFFTLRLESAFVLSDKNKDLKVIFSSIIFAIIVGSILASILVVFLPDIFFSKIKLLRVYAIFCVIGGVLKAVESVYLSYLLKLKEFKRIANSRVLFIIIRYAFQIGLFYYATNLGLILGFIVASVVLIFYFYKFTGNLFDFISIDKFKTTLRENQNLVSYGVLSDNLNAINLNIIPILAGVYFKDSEIGWYFLAVVLLSVPLTFIGASFSKVFFLKASEIFNTNPSKLFSFLKKWTIQLSFIIIPYIILALLSKPFIEVALKDEWIPVSSYIQWLSLLFFLRAVYNPISHLEEVLKKNHIGLIFNIFLLSVNIGAILYGAFVEKSFFFIIETISIVLPLGYIGMIGYFLLVTFRLKSKLPL